MLKISVAGFMDGKQITAVHKTIPNGQILSRSKSVEQLGRGKLGEAWGDRGNKTR